MNQRITFLSLLLIFCLNVKAQGIYNIVCEGNLTRLDSILKHEKLNVTDERGRSLLHWAVGCNQISAFDNLIKRGLALNSEDKDGYTPLYVAVQFKRDSLFGKIIGLQENNNWKSKQGAPLLERAILDDKLSYVEKLIQSGVDIEIKNKRGSSPLEIAQRTGAEEIEKWLIVNGADPSKVRNFTVRGQYMGETPPQLEKKIFAPNFISTEEFEFGSVFNAAGNEFYYAIAKGEKPFIRYSKLENGIWSEPVTILSSDKYGYNDPFLSPDENRLYFISKRTMDGSAAKEDHDIWYIERQGSGWSEPINAGPNINTKDNEYYISFTSTGTMYFASNVNAKGNRKRANQDIYYATFKNGEFQKPVALGNAINTENYEADVFIAPDESYLIYCSTRPEGLGRGDLYISFKEENGLWSKGVNMGELVNTEHHELCPFVTADGKYLMYTSNEDIYWISTKVFDELKK
ncbi:ankyrin repeat domain-containing protein [Roseivirga sp.]|uniref:ankyrin repeat domain-containing protein n=1 Tax=Roseivirga sp. TaxID=1964215 RepID=UPI003B8CFB35